MNKEPIWKKNDGQRMSVSGIHSEPRKDSYSSQKNSESNMIKLSSRRALPYRDPTAKNYSLNTEMLRSGSLSGGKPNLYAELDFPSSNLSSSALKKYQGNLKAPSTKHVDAWDLVNKYK